MKTAISFPENDDEEEEEEEEEEELLRFDALVPSTGWVPVQQVNSRQVCLLFDPSHTRLPLPSQTSPLYSRSFTFGSAPAPGQGVLVLDAGTWKRGVVHDSTAVRLTVGGDKGKLVAIGELRPLFSQVVAMQGDGNCLYRAVSQQVYGTPNHHALCRQACYEYIKLERAYFEPFVKGQFDAYLQVLQRNGSWGDDPELEALGAIYRCTIQVYSAHQLQLVKQYDGGGGKGRTVRLVFYAEGHYDVLEGGGGGSRPPPPSLGQMELQAIEQCKIRQAGGVQQALLQSDLLGTEEVQLEECETLCAIRQTDEANLDSQLLAQAMQDSLDEAMQDSLNEAMLNQALEDSLYL